MTQSRENAGFCRLGKQALTAGLALRVLIALLAAISLIQAGSCFSPARAGAEMLGLVSKLEALEIVTSSGAHKFSVEVMRSEKQRERGLMFRRTLPQDQGMLFIFPFEQPVAMWMKNTSLPPRSDLHSGIRKSRWARRKCRASFGKDHSLGQAGLCRARSQCGHGCPDWLADWRYHPLFFARQVAATHRAPDNGGRCPAR